MSYPEYIEKFVTAMKDDNLTGSAIFYPLQAMLREKSDIQTPVLLTISENKSRTFYPFFSSWVTDNIREICSLANILNCNFYNFSRVSSFDHVKYRIFLAHAILLYRKTTKLSMEETLEKIALSPSNLFIDSIPELMMWKISRNEYGEFIDVSFI